VASAVDSEFEFGIARGAGPSSSSDNAGVLGGAEGEHTGEYIPYNSPPFAMMEAIMRLEKLKADNSIQKDMYF
jgi:hypothetical protein